MNIGCLIIVDRFRGGVPDGGDPLPVRKARAVAIVGARVVDGLARAALLDATAIVRGERIVAVGKRAAVSGNSRWQSRASNR